MRKGTAADNLKAIETTMDALRSELLKFSEKEARQGPQDKPDPLHLPLMHSIMTIQEAMRTFLSLATARNG